MITRTILATLIGTLSGAAWAQTGEVVMDSGRYLVTLSFLEDCSPSAYDLDLSWQFAAAIGDPQGGRDEALIGTAARVIDNLIRPAVCREGLSTGTALVNTAAEAEIKADSRAELLPDATLTVERITSTKKVASKPAAARIGKGEYIVTVTGLDDCNGNREVNLTRKIDYNFAAGKDDSIQLVKGRLVRDNWIRPAVCVSGPVTGQAHIIVGKPTRLTPPAGFKIKQVERVTGKSGL